MSRAAPDDTLHRFPLRSWIRCSAVPILVLQVGCRTADHRPLIDARSGLTFRGSPGLIDVPTAEVTPAGSVDLGYSHRRERDVFAEIEEQASFVFAMGLLDFFTLGGRGVSGSGPSFGLRDLSANVHLRPLAEGPYWPSVAIGATDVGGGAVKFESKYLTLSKSVLGLLRATLGYGSGVLPGVFGGIELVPTEFTSLVAEYDGTGVNLGLRLFPLPEALEYLGLPRPNVDITYDGFNDKVSWSVGLRYVLGEPKFVAQREARNDHRYRRPPKRIDFDVVANADQLASELAERGFENVVVSVHRSTTGFSARIQLENRIFARDAMDGIGVALGTALKRLEPPFDSVVLSILSSNINVAELRVGLDDLESFLDDEVDPEAFSDRVEATNGTFVLPEAIHTTERRASSWPKVDVFLRPGLETLALTEVGVFDYRVTALPDANLELWSGAVLDARLRIPLYQSDPIFGGLGIVELDRLLLHQAFRLPIPEILAMGQVSIGRFASDWYGMHGELYASLFGGPVSVRASIGRVGREASVLSRWTAVLDATGHYAPWDLTLSASGGLFLDQDLGLRFELGRFFGTTEVSAFFRTTENGNLAGLAISVPLTLGEELPPWVVRPRLPELFSYAVATTVSTDKNYITETIGRTVTYDREIDRSILARERLVADRIRNRAEELRASIRWLVEPTSVETSTNSERN